MLWNQKRATQTWKKLHIATVQYQILAEVHRDKLEVWSIQWLFSLFHLK